MGKKLGKLLAILLIAVLTVFIYYAIVYSIDFSIYVIAYEFMKIKRSFDFGKTIWIYLDYILPYFLAFTNLMLAVVENKTINRIAVFVAYSICIFWFWGNYIISPWPYRAIPVFCILTGFYIFDILMARFIVKKILRKDIL